MTLVWPDPDTQRELNRERLLEEWAEEEARALDDEPSTVDGGFDD